MATSHTDVEIDLEIIVYDAVPHTNDRFPGNLRVSLLERIADAARRLADHLDQVGEGHLQIFVVVELLTRQPNDLGRRLARHVEHVAHVDQVILGHTDSSHSQESARVNAD